MVTETPDLPPALETEHYTEPTREVPRGRKQRITLLDRALNWLAAGCQAGFGPREASGFGILTYHRIANPVPNRPRPTWNVPPPRLERQLAGLVRRGWQAWPLLQLLHYVERELPIPRKTFVITFDDGYANVFLHALPVLTRLRLPATLFLSTAYLDSKEAFPGDDWSAAGTPGTPSDTWRFLSTSECQRLAGNGLIEIGAHTHTHADFRGRPNDMLADLQENLLVLHEKLGVQQPTFALPYGTLNDGFAGSELVQAARQAGVRCCLNAEAAVVSLQDNPFSWGRITATEYDTAATLAGKLGGWHSALRGLGRKALDGRPRVHG
jgi:peptidoglycan/xylan/chitin deacetylase (PgdA/CDA1 family)